ncbi:hypothetical protein Syun_020753 [Stephania yunnanensis]|uniref:Uncharacterized protein n=1 Tax=Stephania yunnanensis TaxID=152371 RepID=A0AAP0IFP6_9MAGN
MRNFWRLFFLFFVASLSLSSRNLSLSFSLSVLRSSIVRFFQFHQFLAKVAERASERELRRTSKIVFNTNSSNRSIDLQIVRAIADDRVGEEGEIERADYGSDNEETDGFEGGSEYPSSPFRRVNEAKSGSEISMEVHDVNSEEFVSRQGKRWTAAKSMKKPME